MKNKSFVLSVLCLIIGLSACAPRRIADTKLLDEQAMKHAASSPESPRQVCDLADQAIREARNAELEFYAPLHLKQAIKAMESGRRYIENPKTELAGKQACFKANKLVAKGITVKLEVKKSLALVLDELERLRKYDENNQFGADIRRSVDAVINLIKYVEAGKMAVAVNRQQSVIEDMQKLELEIVLHNYIKPVEVMMKKAESAGARILAKNTLEQAVKELVLARNIIKEKYRDKEVVKNTSDNALREAKHAYYVALEVDKLQLLKPEEAEQKVLYFESLLENINKQLSGVKVTGNSLEDQSIIIAEQIKRLVDELRGLNQRNQEKATNKQ